MSRGILYSVINVGYSNQADFQTDYKKLQEIELDAITAEEKLRANSDPNVVDFYKRRKDFTIKTLKLAGDRFEESHNRIELVKIRDMSRNSDSFTLKENGFCYVDMAEDFEGKNNYHCSLIMFYNAWILADSGTDKGLLGLMIPKVNGIYNNILQKLIYKIFGGDIEIDPQSVFSGPDRAHIFIKFANGQRVNMHVKSFDGANPIVFRKGPSRYLPKLHMDYNITKDLGRAKSFQSRINENERMINYWVNLTRDKSSPDFDFTFTEPWQKQLSDHEKRFETYMETSNGNPLYSNSLVLCDKKTTSQTIFAEKMQDETLKPVDYSYISDEQGMLPVTYDGLPYGCGYFFSSQEVMHSALSYTSDSLAIFPNPEKVFKSELDKMSLKEMKELAISFGAPKKEVKAAPLESILNLYKPGGNLYEKFLEWEKSKRAVGRLEVAWKKYVERKKKEEDAATKIQARVRGYRVRKPKGQDGGSLDPYGGVIRESLEMRFIVKITGEKGEPLTDKYLGEHQIGQIFTTL